MTGRLEQDTPEDDGWVDITYGPGNPCPYPLCHHNQPEPEGGPS